MNNKSLGAIILAAGKGKRMNLQNENKVALLLHDKPIITHIVHFMQKLHIKDIVVVVGHAKESVIHSLKNEKVIFARQVEQLGTGHALGCGLQMVPREIRDVLVVYGDDAVLYSDSQLPVINNLLSLHKDSNASVTLLTIELDNPTGLGRIVRDESGKLISIVEEKDASKSQRNIKEINPGCFLFKVEFLREYVPRIKKSPVTGEYYLTNVIDLAFINKEKIETLKGGRLHWRGINTKEELMEASQIFSAS